MKQKIEIFFHNQYADETNIEVKRQGAKTRIIKIVDLLLKAFYYVGLGIVWLANLPKKIFHFIDYLPKNAKQIKRVFKFRKFRSGLVVFLLFAGLAGLLQAGGIFSGQGYSIAGKVLGTTDQATTALENAKNDLQLKNFESAQSNLKLAEQIFGDNRDQVSGHSKVLSSLWKLVPNQFNAANIFEAARILSQAGIDLAAAYQLIDSAKIGAAGIYLGQDNKASIEQVINSSRSALEKIVMAQNLLAEIDVRIFPESERAQFLAVRDSLAAVGSSSQTFADGIKLLESFLIGKKKILILFQNNNEIRPTGGFIGTIGTLNLENGAVQNLDIRSVYDFDGQIKENILPPQPLIEANTKWYLRDSNWFLDFPMSAGRVISMYELGGGETPDLVIAITPDLITELLKEFGPVSLPQHRIELNADNFVELAQKSTSVTYNKQNNQPKQMLADFFPALMQKIGDHPNGFSKFSAALISQVYQKNLLIYSRDEGTQAILNKFNWSGKLADYTLDYLALSFANVGGTKTDRFLKREIDLSTSINAQGDIINTLKINLDNPLPNKIGLENKSFIRIYAPLGSKLLATEGFTKNSLPLLPQESYRKDIIVEDLERSMSVDSLSGVYTQVESGKTVFGNFAELKGGEKRQIVVKYQLPAKVSSLDSYSIVIQKQPGLLTTPMIHRVNYHDREKIWETLESKKSNEAESEYGNEIDRDKFYGLTLKQAD